MSRVLGFLVLGSIASAAVAYVVLTVLAIAPQPLVNKANGLDAEERVLMAAYQHQMREFGITGDGFDFTFCLARGSDTLRKPKGAAGKGPSPSVVAALAALGYDVVSAADCVYRGEGFSVGAFVSASKCPTARIARSIYRRWATPSASRPRCPAVILFIGPVEIGEWGSATVEASHWYDSLGCEGETLRFSLGGQYLRSGSYRRWIC